MSDRDARIQSLQERGFAILPSILTEVELQELTSALRPHEDARPMGRNSFEGELSQRVYSLAGKGEPFLRLATHPAIVELLDALLLPQALLSTLQSIRLHPGETAQPWHTDDAFYDVPRPRERLLGLSVIWAIEDFTEANGATQLVSASHLWGNEHPDDAPREIVSAVMPRGSALVFNAGLWHRGGANLSSGTRLCISPQYCQPWLRPQESQLLIVPPEAAKNASPKARSMLGYNIHPPFVGQVDGMHPLRLVDPEYRTKKTRDHETADRVPARPTARFGEGT
jgi:ectoine hydroxylase-related dioxygenase (phytanoyl-CoA dioxygenase family)